MIALLSLPEKRQKEIFTQLANLTSLRPQVVEKDWWVTLTLKAIFQTEYGNHLLFKGGTSLSKCWKLIGRFSEDIDLAIDREFLGFPGELSKTKIKELKKTACEFTSTKLRDAIEEQLIALGVSPGTLSITAKPVKEGFPDTDPQELQIQYPSLFERIPYIVNLVKIEVSGRSLREPWSVCSIQSLLSEYIPGQSFSDEAFTVPAVEPKRTFLEKLFLLHEEFQRKEKMRHERMSRHLYDVAKLMHTHHGWDAIQDTKLYHSIIQHRAKYHNLQGVDYTSHTASTINFIPPDIIRKEYEQDYNTMRNEMINDPFAPSFALIIELLEELQFHLQNPVYFNEYSHSQLIENALQNDPKDSNSPNFMIEDSHIKIPLFYDKYTYFVTFLRRNKELDFYSLRAQPKK